MSAGVILFRLAVASALVAVNGFFVVAEFALVSVRRSRIEELIAQGNAMARVARRAIEDPDRFIAVTQLGITLASLGLGWIGEPAFADVLAPVMAAVPGPWDKALVRSVAGGVAFALITFLHVVLGELTPKSIALQYPERASLVVARPILLAERLLRPFVWLLNGAGNGLLRLLGLSGVRGHQRVHSVEELKILMRESQESGAIEAAQRQMLEKVFLFGDRQVGEVMVPRPEVVGIEAEATVADLMRLFAAESHARFPVYGRDLDDVVGVLAIKDVLRALAEDPARTETPIGRLARPALFVPETMAVADLLAKMRVTQSQMAVVLDEYGGTAGIVTLEALVEVIVGQLSDELVAREEPVIRVDERTVEIDAQLRVDEVNERLGIDLPEGEEYETVAGLILYGLQRIPKEGDQLPQKGLVLTVTAMKGPKIEKVQIRRTE